MSAWYRHGPCDTMLLTSERRLPTVLASARSRAAETPMKAIVTFLRLPPVSPLSAADSARVVMPPR